MFNLKNYTPMHIHLGTHCVQEAFINWSYQDDQKLWIYSYCLYTEQKCCRLHKCNFFSFKMALILAFGNKRTKAHFFQCIFKNSWTSVFKINPICFIFSWNHILYTLWVVIPSEIFSCFLKASKEHNFYAYKITVFLTFYQNSFLIQLAAAVFWIDREVLRATVCW